MPEGLSDYEHFLRKYASTPDTPSERVRGCKAIQPLCLYSRTLSGMQCNLRVTENLQTSVDARLHEGLNMLLKQPGIPDLGGERYTSLGHKRGHSCKS